MGFKYQILACTSPVQYMHLTLLHLETVKDLSRSPEVTHILNICIDKLIEGYSSFSDSQWMAIKIEIYKFLQGKKVKVSLFLQKDMQHQNGDLLLPHTACLPFGTDIPGKVTYFDGATPRKVLLPLPFPDNPTDYFVGPTILDVRSKLGANLYYGQESSDIGEYSAESISQCLAALESRAPFAGYSVAVCSFTPVAYKSRTEPSSASAAAAAERRAASAKAEISLLSDLIGIKSSKEEDSKPLKLNLFPTSSFGGSKESDYDEDDGYNGSSIIMLDIDGSSGAKTVQRYMEDLDLRDSKAEAKDSRSGDDDEEDDLLALMDSAK